MKRLDGYVPQRESSKEIQDFLQLLIYLPTLYYAPKLARIYSKCMGIYGYLNFVAYNRHCSIDRCLNNFFDEVAALKLVLILDEISVLQGDLVIKQRIEIIDCQPCEFALGFAELLAEFSGIKIIS